MKGCLIESKRLFLTTLNRQGEYLTQSPVVYPIDLKASHVTRECAIQIKEMLRVVSNSLSSITLEASDSCHIDTVLGRTFISSLLSYLFVYHCRHYHFHHYHHHHLHHYIVIFTIIVIVIINPISIIIIIIVVNAIYSLKGIIIQPLLQSCRLGAQSLQSAEMSIFMLNNVSVLQVTKMMMMMMMMMIMVMMVIKFDFLHRHSYQVHSYYNDIIKPLLYQYIIIIIIIIIIKN